MLDSLVTPVEGEAASRADLCFVLTLFPALSVAFLAIVPLLGHLMPASGIFEVLPSVAGTHPATSVMALLLALSLCLPQRPVWCLRASMACAGAVFLMAAGRFVPEFAELYRTDDGQTMTAMNTAAVFLMLALARFGLEGRGVARGQLIALASLTVLFAAFIGYLFEDAGLYGYMSLTTVLLSGGLVCALLCRRATSGLVAAFLAMGPFRIDLALSILGPIAIGWALVHFGGYEAQKQVIALALAHIVGMNILLQMVGLRRSYMIEKKRRASEERRMWEVVTDEVTGVFNRAALRKRFVELMEEVQETRRPLGVAILDLDGFARINEAEGFEYGDKVLRQVAQAILPHLGDDDFIGRSHADEFLIYFPGLRAPEVAVRMRKICHMIAQIEGLGLTASAGIARCHFSETGKQVYQRVLAALEVARLRGGGQVCVAPGPGGGRSVWSAGDEDQSLALSLKPQIMPDLGRHDVGHLGYFGAQLGLPPSKTVLDLSR